MAYNPNRLSTMTSVSNVSRPGGGPQSAQVSTQTLLNALHNAFLNSRPHSLEFSTSLAVNTWVTDQHISPDGRVGGVVDQEFADRVWQHARRRAEDGSVVLGSLHQSTPSMMSSFVSALPLQVPGTFYTALSVIRAFTHCVTPNNPSLPRYSSLATQCTLNQEGDLLGVSFALSTSGLDTQNGLLKIPAEAGYRAFDVFYYLNVSSASPAERDFLGLKPCSAYSLLRRSGTYSPPSYLPTADDAAAAEDFRNSLRAIGIRGPAMHNLISTLAGILKLGDTLDAMADADAVYNICDEAAVLLDMDPTVLRVKCTSEERGIFVAGLYESVVDWVIRHANNAIKEDMKSPANGSGPGTPRVDDINEDTVCINVIEVPDSNLGKAIAFRTVFDDTQGINLEMKEDGVPVVPAGATVLNEMKAVVAACGPDLGEMDSAAGRERDMERDRREGILERIAHQCEDGFLKELLHPIPNQGVVLGEPQSGRVHLSSTLNSSRVWFHLSLHPTDEPPSTLAEPGNHWSAAAVSGQLRAWRLPEWANRRNRQLDFTADFDPVELVDRYASLGCNEGREGIETWLLERGWTNGEVVIGETRIWLRESAWWEAECMKDALPPPGTVPLEATYAAPTPAMESSFFSDVPPGSRDQLLTVPRNSGSTRPTSVATPSRRLPGDYSLGTKGDQYKGEVTYEGQDPELGDGKVVQEKEVGFGRRLWVAIAWILTIWMPSPFLRYIGRMKRPDVRLAWREKVSLVFIILLINATVVFYIIFFGKLLCPNWDKAWDTTQVGFHQGTNDYWVSHRGKVYDLTKFYKIQHSDTNIAVTNDVMMTFAGTNIDPLVAPPLTIACPNLVTDETLILTSNATVTNPTAIHMQGPFFQPDPLSKLRSISWYTDRFLPTMNKYHKGDLVWDINYVRTQGQAGYSQWVIINGDVYDLTDYFNTKLNVRKNVASYAFFPSWFEDMVQGNNGADVTELFNGEGNKTSKAATMQCLKNYFYTGPTDYRKTPRCQVNNYILLAFTVILCTVILTKFLAALQLGSKRQPARQDKFVICQVPAYTEGEEQLRNGLDSLTALAYDNKRKLICVICDGVIVGKGNDRPTAKLVLDILGVDPKTDAPALPFKSVGQGSEQLNYGKVYSGLYEFEGNVVPYLVVVKVGKESEQNKPKPGNRGKRDSQIVLMSFLNRVHHRSPMSPLELEMFHQINNVIGVDPELYEYLLMVDADTMVKEDSLNRLVAACANDSKIAGICGETSLQNQERSWWTMIQVYEYYISHHLAKAFESLFGSVTCLPGCFCMYRLRTADKGRPLIISDKVIDDYSDGDVDTLHKKNLLSLGEDRYLTTLMMKHFPGMSYKFVPTALACTAAPDTWAVLLSQRRRWINSTIHNLAELVFLSDMCGFCCFSMRFVVFIDLFGTIILPATCAYLAYLLYLVGTKTGQFPLISIIMLSAVYGLQAVIFIIKRQWQHIGWMVIYMIAFPIYSFVLPIYSFWKQDDFSWGSTRMVLEEKGKTKVVQFDKDDGFNPRDIPLMRWDDYAHANGLPGGRGEPLSEKLLAGEGMGYEGGYEMDARSVVSSVKPGSAFNGGMGGGLSIPNPIVGARSSMYTLGGGQHHAPQRASYVELPGGPHRRSGSMGSDAPLAPRPISTVYPVVSGSAEHLPSPTGSASALRSRSALGLTPPSGSPRPVSMAASAHLGVDARAEARMSAVSLGPVNFMDGPRTGPSDAEIAAAVRECLAEVDIERFTKKQLVALVELKLQCQVSGERKKVLERWIDVELERLPV